MILLVFLVMLALLFFAFIVAFAVVAALVVAYLAVIVVVALVISRLFGWYVEWTAAGLILLTIIIGAMSSDTTVSPGVIFVSAVGVALGAMWAVKRNDSARPEALLRRGALRRARTAMQPKPVAAPVAEAEAIPVREPQLRRWARPAEANRLVVEEVPTQVWPRSPRAIRREWAKEGVSYGRSAAPDQGFIYDEFPCHPEQRRRFSLPHRASTAACPECGSEWIVEVEAWGEDAETGEVLPDMWRVTWTPS
jgi:hypothetical protein